MIYKIIHTTTYNYEENVELCHNQLRLQPRNFEGQLLLDYNLQISPKPSDFHNHLDYFSNNVTFFSIQFPHNELIVCSESTVKRDSVEYDILSEGFKISIKSAKEYLQHNSNEINDARQYLFRSKYISLLPQVFDYAKLSYSRNRGVFDATLELIQRIYQDFSFVSGFTSIATPLEQVFEEKKGVCQDFAHFAIACLRTVGLPARYVSGYIETIPPNGEKKLVGADASHAWFSVYIPFIGWIDFDPTNNLLVKNQHVTIGWGSDYFDIIPVKGVVFSSGKSTLKVSVDMFKIQEFGG